MRDLGPMELRHTSEYHIWQSMIARCHNPNANGYERYGAVGITVAKRWRESFPNFLKDVGMKPGAEYSLDRIKGSKGYQPGNCRWATITEQNRNRSNNRRLLYKGKEITLAEVAEQTGVGRMTISHRLNAGQTIEQAVRKPFTRYMHEGKELTLREWAEELGVKYSTLYKRVVLLHWPLAKALAD